MFTFTLNNIPVRVILSWSLRHAGIFRNKLADTTANITTRICVLGGFMYDVDFGLSQESAIARLRTRMWREYHISFDRTYYDQIPKKPRLMRGLSRMDNYCLIRLRSGTHVRTSCNCADKYDHLLVHLWGCQWFAGGKPTGSSCNDKNAAT